jgi:hypothetical protein
MSGERRPLEHLTPWLGIVTAALAWAVTHQIGSDSVFDDCRVADTGLILLTGLGGIAIALLGGYFSFDIWRRRAESEGRRFIGLVGMLLVLLATFAIVLQTASSLILPGCAA